MKTDVQGHLGSRIGEGATEAGQSVFRADGDKSHDGNSHLESLSYLVISQRLFRFPFHSAWSPRQEQAYSENA